MNQTRYSGKLTLRNTLHNTTANVTVKDGIISKASLHRAEKKLCGVEGCSCGSIRGLQDREIEILHYADGREARVR